MAKDPCFLMYSSDFISGTSDLTMEERGQYITLLCLQHQKGHLSEKTIRLSVGSASVDVLKKFSQDHEGNFFNTRLEKVIEERLQFTNSRRLNGMKGGRPKKPIGKPTDNLPEDENENENENEGEGINTAEIKKFLIPRMSAVFVSYNPNYPANREKDSEKLFSIAQFFCQQGKFGGSPELHTEKIIEVWEPVCAAISKDKFYKHKSLSTISNHIQEILQNVLHGKSDSKSGKQINRDLLNQKFNERYSAKGQTGDQPNSKVA